MDSLIGSSYIFGQMVGAAIGGKVI